MRPRHVVILTLLAAIPVALAIVVTGSGGGRASGPAAYGQVSLKLLGGAAGSVTGCGKSHPSVAYGSQSTIRFRGAVSPPGAWSVAVKLKACYGGSFQSAGEVPAALRSSGTYAGTFPAPVGGIYYARAELRRSGVLVARSEKRYFEVR